MLDCLRYKILKFFCPCMIIDKYEITDYNDQIYYIKKEGPEGNRFILNDDL